MARPRRADRTAHPEGQRRRPRWVLAGALALAGLLAVGLTAAVFTYVALSRLIDARLSGERERTLPQVFARPFELRQGQALTVRELVERLNDLGYTLRARPEQPGEFAVGSNLVLVVPREGPARGRLVEVRFPARPPRGPDATRIERITVSGRGALQVHLGTPLLTALITTGRVKRRQVPLAEIPPHMVQAVLAIEDRRFYEHPGIDPIGILRAIWTNLRGERPYLVGGSTLTQQLVKNLFLRPEKTLRRKLLEQAMALLIEQRLSKDDILELYLNEVYLGQRGSFAIHGVAEAARLFFGKDVRNVTLGEAATIAGVIQAPQLFSPFRNLTRARARRDVVLQAMVEAGYLSADAARRAAREPLAVVEHAIENEAPYFVDYVSQQLEELFPDVTRRPGTVEVHTTIDVHLQRIAQEAVAEGLARVDRLVARRGLRGAVQAALIAVDPRSGDILALVGGRSYSDSQYNRAVYARRQPGSVFKPFVYLAAFEQAVADGATDLTPATVVVDEPTAFFDGERSWTPANYGGQYDGPITLRRALAFSRNVATVKVAERAGFDRVAAFWRRIGTGTVPRPYPSIALGVFEATPLEIATAYTLFANGGVLRPLRGLVRVVRDGRELRPPAGQPRRVARPDTTFLVTHMMRSVLNEGTGAAARAAGFTLDAAGKSGTTNDLRDAWFVGFAPTLLTVVWVGLDDNRPLGLSGTQAALPIWTTFMMRALAGQPNLSFPVPEGVTFAEIDPDTGALAAPACPRRFTEAFLVGTEPSQVCPLHSF